jgi:Icc-related predicted phosphoesterase
MRLHVLSDLHIEFGPFNCPRVNADVTVLAGDVHIKRNGLRWIRKSIPGRPVVYVVGNHEFYGEKFPRLIEKLKAEAADTDVRVLENDTVELGSFRFFGATLWTDLRLFGDDRIGASEVLLMNDYKRVRKTPSYRKLRPVDTQQHHLATVDQIRRFLREGDPRRSIVITHHAPSMRSIPEEHRSDLISCAYASNLDGMIVESAPLLWVHGHVHDCHDYTIGSTRIVANPRGYVDAPNESFDPGLVIDLEEEFNQNG